MIYKFRQKFLVAMEYLKKQDAYLKTRYASCFWD